MSNVINGRSRRNYVGTNAPQPPNITFVDRQPNQYDRENYEVGDQWLYTDPTPGTNYQELWYLASLKGNSMSAGKLAKWVLVASGTTGNVSSFQLDVGTAHADDDGIVNLLAGENTNTEGDNLNTMRVNLNRTIYWPSTNLAGTEGVIYLDNHRFLHNYGLGGAADANTFLGVDAGNISIPLSGVGATGIGFQALKSITSGQYTVSIGANALTTLTNGDNNTACGAFALDQIQTGMNNIGLGYSAGTALTGTDSNNICIGNVGVSGEDATIRIGTAGTHVETYVAGITGVTINNETPMTVVNVGTDGQLGEVILESDDASIAITQPSAGVINFRATGGGGGGSSNPFSFSAVQVGDSGAIANGTDYAMGANVALTELFDVGNNFYPGDGAGAPAVFTAPVSGKYYFEFLSLFIVGAGAGTTCDSQIIAGARTYQAKYGSSTQTEVYSVITDMTMGQTAVFSLINPVAGAPDVTYAVSGNGGSRGATNTNSTRISGFLIPESSNGGAFSQPFRETIALAVAGGGGFKLLGTASTGVLVEDFDIGSNFYIGDGAAAEAYFEAPETGIYSISFTNQYQGTTAMVMRLIVNGVTYREVTQNLPVAYIDNTQLIDLAATDKVTFSFANSVNSNVSITVSGYRIG